MRQTYQINEKNTLKHSSSVSSMYLHPKTSTMTTNYQQNSTITNNDQFLSNQNNKYITSHPLTTNFPK